MEKQVLDSKAKQQELEKKYKGRYIVKIQEAGGKLIYRIGLSKTHSEDKDREFLFDVYLLEDLYLNSKDGKNWSLCDCICETRHCIDGDLQMIEPIRGKSLNNLFSNMVAFYFPLQRSGACNAFNTFFLELSGSIPNLANFKYSRQTMPLDKFREELEMKYAGKGNRLF
jgi:hypothetical protein